MLPFALGPENRKALRERLSRNWTLKVSCRDRRMVKRVYQDIADWSGGALDDLRVVPVSSLEWSSEFRKINGVPIIVFDTEEANALNFFCVRAISADRPIFQYTEFAIRAGEFLLSSGEVEAACRTAATARRRLFEYADYHDAGDTYPRPLDRAGVGHAAGVVDSDVVPSFLLGHEIGHFIADYTSRQRSDFDVLRRTWEELAFEASDEGPAFTRFVHPAHLQKLDEEGRPSGNGVIGTAMAPNLLTLQGRMLDESLADFCGIIAASRQGARFEMPPQLLLQVLHTAMEGMERQLLLRQLASRLPRGGRRCGIMLDGSRLPGRVRMLYEIARLLFKGEIGPADVRSYWGAADELGSLDSAMLDRFTHAAERSYIVARGALYYGCGGVVPSDLLSPQQAREKYGIVAGNVISMMAPFYLPPALYDIASQADWYAGEDSPDPALAGFAGAVRDLTSILVHPEPSTGLQDASEEADPAAFEAALVAVRQPRILIQQQSAFQAAAA